MAIRQLLLLCRDMIWYDWVLTHQCCTLVYLQPLYTSLHLATFNHFICLDFIAYAIFTCLPCFPFIFRYSSQVMPFTVVWLQLRILPTAWQIISVYIMFPDDHITTCPYRVFEWQNLICPVVRHFIWHAGTEMS